uniref:Nucleotide exchange factor SIL1 n=1 Tax=Tetraodon nigroviridis TaxID=99883 RepID=H3CLH9_TETNG
NSLVAVKNVDGAEAGGDEQEEAYVDEPEEDLEVVQTSHVWQTLKPGQAVPAGSHVRLNLQTGQREVRMGEEQLKYRPQGHRSGCRVNGEKEQTRSSFSPDELKQAMKKIKEDMNVINEDIEEGDTVSAKFRSLEELKEDMSQLDLLVETDFQIMPQSYHSFFCAHSLLFEKQQIIRDNLLNVDNGQTLCSMGGFQLILQVLNSSDVKLQESAASVLGSALASNPVVQVRAMESGALQTLLTLLATSRSQQVKKKVLFALASLLRHFPYAQRHFLTHGGFQVLSELFRADEGGVLRTRVVTMLYDMISEKELISQAEQNVLRDPSHDERVRQYAEVSLREELLEKGWCALVPRQLESSEHDHREKTLRALLAMAPVCLDQYRTDGSLLDSLLSLRNHYHPMAQTERKMGEEYGYFSEIVELIDALEVQIK